MDFADSIKQIRKQSLMSQTDFAEELGVAFSTVNRWEMGKSLPNYKAKKAIDDYCKKNEIDFDIRQY